MFDWLQKGLYFSPDGGDGGGTDDGAGDEAPEGEPKTKKPEAKVEFSAEQQAAVDAILKDRLARQKETLEKATAKAKADAEAEAEKAKKESADKALAEQQEWQKLAESRKADMDKLAAEKAELEAIKETADKYQAALEKQLEVLKKDLPKHILTLLEKLDPADQLSYIAENAEEFAKTGENLGTPLRQKKSAPKPGEQEVKVRSRISY